MRTDKFPAQKPVLVERVSDDVRVLRKNQVEQQQTVPSMRLLADLLAADPIEKTNPSDANYFVTVDSRDVVDLNKVIDASIRWVASENYIHGPASIKDGAFLQVYAVLKSGALTWNNQDADVPQINDRPGTPIAVRQVIYPSNALIFTTFTRIGIWNSGTETYDWSRWDSLGGGNMLRVMIKTPTEQAGLRALMPNTIYELHCKVSEKIILPRATDYSAGTKIGFEQYPDPTNAQAFSSVVEYTEGEDTFRTTLTPNIDRMRTEGVALLDNVDTSTAAGPIYYEYEVIDTGATPDRTWQLNGDPEALERTSDLATLLAAHTDLMIKDLVKYQSRVFTPGVSSELKCSEIATGAGFVRWCISPMSSYKTNLPDDWSVKLFIYNPENLTSAQVVYSKVAISYDAHGHATTIPDPDTCYYVKIDGLYTLAGVNGHIAAFDDDREYFTQTVYHDQLTPVATVTGAQLKTTEKQVLGYHVAYRGDILLAVVSGIHASASQYVSPYISFYPDPHESLVNKANINNTVFTLTELLTSAKPETVEDQVAGSKALATAYEEIVHNLQRRGLMWGRTVDGDLNNLTTTGLYAVQNGSTLTNGPSDKLKTVGTIIVQSNSGSNGEKLYSADGYAVTTAERLTQIFIGCQSAYDACPKIWIRSAYHGDASNPSAWTWSLWATLQCGPTVIDASGTTLITVDLMKRYLTSGQVFITLNGTSPITVNLPDPALYKGVKCQFEIAAGSSDVTFSYTSGGTNYTQTMSEAASLTGNDKVLCPFECDGTHWFLITAG